MNNTAFVVIAILTLAGALAAATLQKLMHAALSFAVTFVGIAAFFFLLGAEFVEPFIFALPVEEVQIDDRTLVESRRLSINSHKLFGVRIRQRVEQYAVDDGKKSRARANAERESEDCRGHETR